MEYPISRRVIKKPPRHGFVRLFFSCTRDLRDNPMTVHLPSPLYGTVDDCIMKKVFPLLGWEPVLDEDIDGNWNDVTMYFIARINPRTREVIHPLIDYDDEAAEQLKEGDWLFLIEGDDLHYRDRNNEPRWLSLSLEFNIIESADDSPTKVHVPLKEGHNNIPTWQPHLTLMTMC